MTRIEATTEASRLTLETGVTHYATRYGLGAWKVKERYVTPDKSADAERTTLPTEPCFKCGARGWCDHRQPEPTPVSTYVECWNEELQRPDQMLNPKLSAEDTVALMRSKGWTL